MPQFGIRFGRKQWLTMIVVMVLLSTLPQPTVWAESTVTTTSEQDPSTAAMPAVSISAPSSIVVETGRFRQLYGQGETEIISIPTASKVMTALIACERLSLDIQVTISSVAAAADEGFESPDDITLASGDKYPLKYLLYRLMFYNSDAAALAIAEQVASVEESFVELMNARAESYDMSDTIFYNSTGRQVEIDITDSSTLTSSLDLQHTTLLDFAKLVYQAVANDTFNSILRSSAQYIILNGSTFVTMRNAIDDIWIRSEGLVTGAMTGSQNGLAYSLAVGSANGVSLIAITAGGSPSETTNDLIRLFRGCENFYTSSALVYAGQAFDGPPEQTVDGETFGLVYKQTVFYVHPIDDSQGYVKDTLRYNSLGPFSRPIQLGMTVGQVIFELADGTTISVDVSPDRQILSSISILDKALSELQGNANLALVLIICGFVLILVMLTQTIRRLYRVIRLAWLVVLEKRIRH